MMHSDSGAAPKPMEMTPTEVAHAWQDFRKECVRLAIDAKATAMEDNIIPTAEAIASYIITKSKEELANAASKEKLK